MLALSNPMRATPCLLPATARPEDIGANATASPPHKFTVGKWTITVSECGDNMLQLSIDSLADPANPLPVMLAAAADQDLATVTVLAANSRWRSPPSSMVVASAKRKRAAPCEAEEKTEEERPANVKRCRVEQTEELAAVTSQAAAAGAQMSTPIDELDVAGFSCLPDEVKLHVFAMLPPMSLLRTVPLVSREWCSLAHDEALWRSLYSRHIGGTTPSPTAPPAPSTPSLYATSHAIPTIRRLPQSSKRQAFSLASTSTTWRGSTSSVLRHLRSAFADLRSSLHELAERQRRESENRMSRWLAQTVEWMVDGGHAPLLASFLRDVSRFAPIGVIRSTLADRRFLLGAAKSGHVGAVTTLVAFGADLGQAMVLAAMNRDAVGLASLFRAYAHIKSVLCAEYRRQQGAANVPCHQAANRGRRLFGLVAGVRDSMRTCMNLASVARDRELLELLANLCASDADLREAHDFAHFVKIEGPLASRRRSRAFHDDDESDEESSDEDEDGVEEGEDSDDDEDAAEL